MPTPVPSFDGLLTCIAASSFTALAISGGDLYVWGLPYENGASDLLAPHRLAAPAEAPAPFVSVSVGAYFGVVIDSRGSVWWWGRDSFLTGLTSTLARVPGAAAHAVQVAVGVDHGLVLLATGAVYGLGRNDHNQAAPLPVTAREVHQPTLVAGLGSISISTVHAGRYTSFVVSEAGEVFAWGFGGRGGLATGTTEDRRAGPGRVEALRSVEIRSLGGTPGLVAVATNAETGNEEYYTWGPTCAYISDDAPEFLL